MGLGSGARIIVPDVVDAAEEGFVGFRVFGLDVFVLLNECPVGDDVDFGITGGFITVSSRA